MTTIASIGKAIIIKRVINKRSKELIPPMKQRRLRTITFKVAKEKSPILRWHQIYFAFWVNHYYLIFIFDFWYQVLKYIDRAERHDFWPQFLLFILLFFFLFLEGKIKREKNNQSRDQKSCLSARSIYLASRGGESLVWLWESVGDLFLEIYQVYSIS